MGVYGIEKINNLIQKFFPTFDVLNINNYICEFIALLILYFDDTSLLNPHKSLPNSIAFPKVPYLIYKTPLKFDRIRNQCGVFLYQGFLDYYTEPDDMGGIMIQKIRPDIVIEINNKTSILEELDMVGINKKFIYGDFDNVAQYINKKFYK